MRCFLSAGHHDDPWTTGEEGAHSGGMVEHVVAARITAFVAAGLRLIRPALVPSLPLPAKIEYVNRWSEPGDLAVEVHLNAFDDPAVSGVEALYAAGSVRGEALALRLAAALATGGARNRGAKPDTTSARKRLAWCRDTMPWAVVLEVGFLTSGDDLARIEASRGRNEAKRIAGAIDRMA